MPSFIVHHIAGELLLKKVVNNDYNNRIIKSFRTGNLIADATPKYEEYEKTLSDKEKQDRNKLYIQKQIEKNSTHFRQNNKKIILAPDLNKFIKKYNYLLESGNSQALGYLFHLYVDNKFFEFVLPKFFTLYDDYAIIHKTKKEVKIEQIFSNDPGSIYYDYTILNKKIVEKYSNIISSNATGINNFNKNDNSIEEVSNADITKIVNEMNNYLKESYELESDFYIFDEKEIFNYIEDIVNNFYQEYKLYLDKVFNKE